MTNEIPFAERMGDVYAMQHIGRREFSEYQHKKGIGTKGRLPSKGK